MSDTPKLDDASTGGGIGDIPAQPVNPASVGSGDTDPRYNSDGVDTHVLTEDNADEADEAKVHPT